MKNELKKTISRLCDEVGTAAACELKEELTDDLSSEYDKRVNAGMAQIDAYRDVLKNIDKIREMLESLPETDEDVTRRKRGIGTKNLERILGRISGCMWLCTVIAYFLVSIISGMWHLTWIIFLWSAIGQIVIGMVKKYNRGKPMKKVFKGGGSAILWLLVVIFYFVISFVSGAWHLTWLIFLVGALVQTFLGLFFE